MLNVPIPIEPSKKAFADKGYIGEKLAKKLFENGIHLMTRIKKEMKNKLMLMSDTVLLRKRAIIESVNNL